MKFSAAVFLVVIAGFLANSSALPAKKRMVYLQQQPQWYPGPQRMMYVQYVQPSRTHARSTQAAAALVAGDSVATGTYLKDCDHSEADIALAVPTVEEKEEQEEEGQQQQLGEDVLGAGGAHSAHAVAEAYPGDNEVQSNEADAQVDRAVDAAFANAVEGVTLEPVLHQGGAEHDAAKVPRDYSFVAGADAANAVGDADSTLDAYADSAVDAEAPAVGAVDVTVADLPAPADVPTPAPIGPVSNKPAKPARRYLPAKKKVYVAFEQSAESAAAAEVDEDDEEEAVVTVEEEEDDGDNDAAVPAVPVNRYNNPVRVPNAYRPTKKATVKPNKAAQSDGSVKPTREKKPLPVGTFFPIDFGGATGGAIAIANSFSTGEGGSATSHAIAYGAPEPARTHARPSKLH